MTSQYSLDYTTVALAMVIGILGMGIMMIANLLLAPRSRNPAKDLPYECGIPPSSFAWSQFHIRYYVFAILFLIFDVEAVFLVPWVLVFLHSYSWVFYEMLLFIGILLFGLLYVWKKGALQWR